jgi:ubiquinol-cytochrome c reductase cytochrome b subunit
VWRWLDSRLGLDALSYPVPTHANRLLYTLGGITAFGFLVLIASGIYLAQFYDPQPATARDSVIYILQSVRFGAFVRGVHFWTANLVVVTAGLHLVRVYASGAYKRPREVNWLVGLALFATTIGFVFTGTVLKWDQEAWEALGHNQAIGELLGGFGTWFTSGFTRSVPLLTRLFVAHVAILPALFALLLALHFALVKRHGISGLPGRHESEGPRSDTAVAIADEGASTFTVHLRHLAGFGLLLTAAVGALTLLFGSPLGAAVTPGPERTQPPWMFLPFFTLENWWGIKALLWAPAVLFAVLVLVPFVDRSPVKTMRRRKAVLIAGAVLLIVLVVLGVLAATTPAQTHLEMG